MKTALLTIGLTVVFFGIGIVVMRVVTKTPADEATVEASGAPADSTTARNAAADSADVEGLADELAQMQHRLAEAEARADSLRRVMAERQEADETAETSAAELATTLTKMEDESLAAIVQRLDGRSFVKLYEAASSRNRGRLLDALTPTQAAAFVRHQLPGGSTVPLHTASGGGVPGDSTSAR